MGHRIILSADSTCDLGPELKSKLNVHYYPFHIIWREGDYQDNVDITTEEIFAGYREDGSLPKTSAINTQEYLDYFRPFVEEGYEVVHLNLGSAISSAHENAKAAAAQLPGVCVVDSCNLSTGIALQLIYAAQWIEEGYDASEVAAKVQSMQKNVRSSFVLDTLDFMAAGGRCPSIMAHMTKALSFHPQVNVNNADGSMKIGKLYRGQIEHVYMKYVSGMMALYPKVKRDHVFVTHTANDDAAEKVVSLLEEIADFENIYVTKASCTIGSHCGPGTLGVLFVTEDAT